MHTGMSRKWSPIKARQIYERRRNARGKTKYSGFWFFFFPAGILDKKKHAAQNGNKKLASSSRRKRRKIRRKFFLRYLNILKFNAIILICRFYVNARSPSALPKKKVKMDLGDWIAHKFNGYNGASGEFVHTHMSSKAEPLIFFGHQNHKHFSPTPPFLGPPHHFTMIAGQWEGGICCCSLFCHPTAAVSGGKMPTSCANVVCSFDRVIQNI